MTMKTDINNRNDIQILVNSFYKKVEKDELIGPFFTEVTKIDWNHHLPQMYDFWESILFGKSIFSGNPMKKHMLLHDKSPLTMPHFDHWLRLFTQTTDELFSGKNATKIKEYASIIKENLAARVINQEPISEPQSH